MIIVWIIRAIAWLFFGWLGCRIVFEDSKDNDLNPLLLIFLLLAGGVTLLTAFIVMLTDPKREHLWIRRFLLLKKKEEVKNDTQGSGYFRGSA